MESNGARAELTLGGESYEVVRENEYTFDQHQWISVATEKAGLAEVPGKVKKLMRVKRNERGELPEDVAVKVGKEIVLRVYDSGQASRILAGTLVPSGREWTREIAAQTEKKLRGLKGHQDFSTMSDMLVGVILGFFASGLESETTSGSSSGPARVDGGTFEPGERQTSETSTP